jgi:hypothetical protein
MKFRFQILVEKTNKYVEQSKTFKIINQMKHNNYTDITHNLTTEIVIK